MSQTHNYLSRGGCEGWLSYVTIADTRGTNTGLPRPDFALRKFLQVSGLKISINSPRM